MVTPNKALQPKAQPLRAWAAAELRRYPDQLSMSNPSPPTAFAGTATYYLRYRPPYPDEFLSDLRSHAKTTGYGSLLDVACGPGRVAIPMAPYFNSVLAVDVEAEMIAVGKQEASNAALRTSPGLLSAQRICNCPPARSNSSPSAKRSTD